MSALNDRIYPLLDARTMVVVRKDLPLFIANRPVDAWIAQQSAKEMHNERPTNKSAQE